MLIFFNDARNVPKLAQVPLALFQYVLSPVLPLQVHGLAPLVLRYVLRPAPTVYVPLLGRQWPAHRNVRPFHDPAR